MCGNSLSLADLHLELQLVPLSAPLRICWPISSIARFVLLGNDRMKLHADAMR